MKVFIHRLNLLYYYLISFFHLRKGKIGKIYWGIRWCIRYKKIFAGYIIFCSARGNEIL